MPSSALQVVAAVEDLRLDGDVERRGRLVGDQQLRLGRRAPWRSSRAGACRRRAGADSRRAARRGIRDARPGRAARPRAAAPRRGRQSRVQPQRLGDLLADVQHRVERRHRLLEDHRDLVAAHAARIAASASVSEVAAVERIAPPAMRPAARGSRRIMATAPSATCRSPIRRPAPRLAARRPADRGRRPPAPCPRRRSTTVRSRDVEDGVLIAGSARRGLSASFSPSPIRLSASTVSRMATPGMARQVPGGAQHARPAPIMLPQLIDVGIAEAEEGRARFDQDRGGDHDRGGDDDRRQGVRQDLAKMMRASAMPRPRAAMHEVPLAQGEELGAHQPRERRPGHDARSRATMVGDRGLSDRHQRRRQARRSESSGRLGEPHQHVVDPAAEIAGDRADHDADDDARQRRGESRSAATRARRGRCRQRRRGRASRCRAGSPVLARPSSERPATMSQRVAADRAAARRTPPSRHDRSDASADTAATPRLCCQNGAELLTGSRDPRIEQRVEQVDRRG